MKLGEIKNDFSAKKDLVIINLSKDIPTGSSNKYRLIGEIHPAYRYWIRTREGKPYPVIAKGFNPETEEWTNHDPLAEIDDSDLKRTEPYYTVNVIDRTDETLKILALKPTILKALIDLANNPDYGDPTDPANGYDITISKIKTGPKPINIKYTVMPGRNNTPLTEEEQELELFNLAEIFKPKDNYIEFIKEKSSILDEYNDDIPDNLG